MVGGGYAGYRLLFPEIYVAKCYQPTRAFVPRKNWTVVDLGANMGFYTLQAAWADKTVRVIAVEPVPVYVEVLKNNATRNNLKNIQVIQAAIGGCSGQQIPITIWYSDTGEPMVQVRIPEDAKRIETIQVPVLTLAEVFELGRIVSCDLLKVDVEGAEYETLEAAPEDIWNRISRIIMEVHEKEGREKEELNRLLKHHGFEVCTKGELLWGIKK